MRRYLIYLVLVAALAAFGCEERVSLPPATQNPSTTTGELEALAWSIVEQAGWPVQVSETELGAVGMAHRCDHQMTLFGFERTHVTGNIYHYSMEVPIGPGPHDRIGLHRVVKERGRQPIATEKTLFCLHGTPGHFEVMFLAGSVTSAPNHQSIAVFLAENDVDVWGIDQAYTLLPQEITDFSFMDGWGMQFDADNLRTAMAVARLTRFLTGNGFGKMNLMGYSTGLMTGFAALNMETQLPEEERHIGGYVPVDYFYKTLDPVWLESECEFVEYVEELLQNGVYQTDYGYLFQTLGFLAQTDPDGESPLIPGLTNLGAALMAAAETGVVFGFPDSIHFLAGVFDEQGNPVDLRYTELNEYLEWLQGFNNYGSNFMEYDIAVLHCDQENSPHDDYLAEIDVPIFFLGAGGGWGDMMDYTASLLTGCQDVTLLNVQLKAEKLLDIGHVDIYTAGNAEQYFWEPVLEWIDAHAD
jgi:pimeloyl-ACP methyl ester carboxylesterase